MYFLALKRFGVEFKYSSSNLQVGAKQQNQKKKFHILCGSLPIIVNLAPRSLLSLKLFVEMEFRISSYRVERTQRKPHGTTSEIVAFIDGVEVTAILWKNTKCGIFLSSIS